MPGSDRIAVVTGASSGIGEATARGLREAGFFVVLRARREDRLMAVARELRGRGLPLDVRDLASIDAFTAAIAAEYGQVEILINNAGLAAGLQPLAQGNDDDWVQMMETNVLGLLRVTRAMLPCCDAPRAHIVNLGSVAGFEVYPGGLGYTASKHAVRAITKTLRLELMGEPIRSPRSSRGWSRPNSAWSDSRGTASGRRMSTRECSHSPARTSPIASCGWSPGHLM